MLGIANIANLHTPFLSGRVLTKKKEATTMPIPSHWIQSLLILSPRRSPIIEAFKEEKSKAMGGSTEETTIHVERQSKGSPTWAVHSTQSQHTVKHSGPVHREAINWPLTVQPAASFLEIVGNGVVVTHLPIQIDAVLQAVICGSGSVNFSWTLTGPYTATSQTQVPLLFTSGSRYVTWRSLAFFPSMPASQLVQICTMKEPISFLAQESGLYLITAFLNEQEASYLPLAVVHT